MHLCIVRGDVSSTLSPSPFVFLHRSLFSFLAVTDEGKALRLHVSEQASRGQGKQAS